jgi:hypothetical protein
MCCLPAQLHELVGKVLDCNAKVKRITIYTLIMQYVEWLTELYFISKNANIFILT